MRDDDVHSRNNFIFFIIFTKTEEEEEKEREREREFTPFVVSSSFYYYETLQLQKGVDTTMTMTPYVHARTCR